MSFLNSKGMHTLFYVWDLAPNLIFFNLPVSAMSLLYPFPAALSAKFPVQF